MQLLRLGALAAQVLKGLHQQEHSGRNLMSAQKASQIGIL
jgi:hypothetical protein